jgi:putative FmdB family regulatory protein
MPIYEYRCESCGHQQEFLQKLSDPPLTVCPKCGKPTFSKMVTAAGFQLKGGGWYVTDFKNSAKPASKPSDASKKEAGESKPAESKPESKSTEPKPATPSKPAASSGDA